MTSAMAEGGSDSSPWHKAIGRFARVAAVERIHASDNPAQRSRRLLCGGWPGVWPRTEWYHHRGLGAMSEIREGSYAGALPPARPRKERRQTCDQEQQPGVGAHLDVLLSWIVPLSRHLALSASPGQKTPLLRIPEAERCHPWSGSRVGRPRRYRKRGRPSRAPAPAGSRIRGLACAKHATGAMVAMPGAKARNLPRVGSLQPGHRPRLSPVVVPRVGQFE